MGGRRHDLRGASIAQQTGEPPVGLVGPSAAEGHRSPTVSCIAFDDPNPVVSELFSRGWVVGGGVPVIGLSVVCAPPPQPANSTRAAIPGSAMERALDARERHAGWAITVTLLIAGASLLTHAVDGCLGKYLLHAVARGGERPDHLVDL